MSRKLSVASIVLAVVIMALGGHAGASQPGIGSAFVIATGIATADSDTTRPGRPGIAFDGTNMWIAST